MFSAGNLQIWVQELKLKTAIPQMATTHNNKPANPHRFQIKMHNFTAECNLLNFFKTFRD